MTSIYGLFDRDGALRYIGKANDPGKRLASHMRDARTRDTPVYRWIRKHGRPHLRVLAEDCADWKAEERQLIAQARASGHRLLNVADGGDEPFCAVDVRRANGRRLNERIRTDRDFADLRDIKRKFSSLLRSKTLPAERKDRLRTTMRECAARAPNLFGSWANI